ncbi:MAG: Camphor resistance CrcB protein, partial [Conexibacter sp.]|nr:Camphor resistance CrcB protein [Conexibacter sp.]
MLLEVRLLLAVFAGGCAGALARAGLIELAPPRAGHWPWVTFAVNVAGAALLGWIATHRSPASRMRAVVGTGFCGALTTFSTMQLELLGLLDAGRVGVAALYAGGSVAAGLAGAAVGIA